MLVLSKKGWGIIGFLEAGESGKVIQESMVYFRVVDLHLGTTLSRLHLQHLILHFSQYQVQFFQ